MRSAELFTKKNSFMHKKASFLYGKLEDVCLRGFVDELRRGLNGILYSSKWNENGWQMMRQLFPPPLLLHNIACSFCCHITVTHTNSKLPYENSKNIPKGPKMCRVTLTETGPYLLCMWSRCEYFWEILSFHSSIFFQTDCLVACQRRWWRYQNNTTRKEPLLQYRGGAIVMIGASYSWDGRDNIPDQTKQYKETQNTIDYIRLYMF